MSEPCLACGSNMQGDPIPQEYIDAGYYAPGATHYSRKMGYDFPGVYDGVLIWGCPDCGHCWPRFSQDTNVRLHDEALRIIHDWANFKEV